MANGILGSADLAATTYTGIYLVPLTTFSVATVSICNKNATSITVRLAVAKTDATGALLPAADDYLEYETEILPNGVLLMLVDKFMHVHQRLTQQLWFTV